VYEAVSGQYIMGPDGAVALNYAEVYRAMDRLDVKNQALCLQLVNAAFRAARDAARAKIHAKKVG
jgi:hypothetical protein